MHWLTQSEFVSNNYMARHDTNQCIKWKSWSAYLQANYSILAHVNPDSFILSRKIYVYNHHPKQTIYIFMQKIWNEIKHMLKNTCTCNWWKFTCKDVQRGYTKFLYLAHQGNESLENSALQRPYTGILTASESQNSLSVPLMS